MQPYHFAWLSLHPERSEEWLKQRLLDGLDVHHADGDHSNNDPSNLVIIESHDHMRLHKLPMSRRLDHWHERRSTRKASIAEFGSACYAMKNPSVSWLQIGKDLNPSAKQPQQWALLTAKAYAQENGLCFPKPNSSMPKKGRATV